MKKSLFAIVVALAVAAYAVLGVAISDAKQEARASAAESASTLAALESNLQTAKLVSDCAVIDRYRLSVELDRAEASNKEYKAKSDAGMDLFNAASAHLTGEIDDKRMAKTLIEYASKLSQALGMTDITLVIGMGTGKSWDERIGKAESWLAENGCADVLAAVDAGFERAAPTPDTKPVSAAP